MESKFLHEIANDKNLRFERFLAEYSKLCTIYGMGITQSGYANCIVINGYCDGNEIFDVSEHLNRLKYNHSPDHLEQIELEIEYIPED